MRIARQTLHHVGFERVSVLVLHRGMGELLPGLVLHDRVLSLGILLPALGRESLFLNPKEQMRVDSLDIVNKRFAVCGAVDLVTFDSSPVSKRPRASTGLARAEGWQVSNLPTIGAGNKGDVAWSRKMPAVTVVFPQCQYGSSNTKHLRSSTHGTTSSTRSPCRIVSH